jgi:outer membrane lipoprotein-sorting protein
VFAEQPLELRRWTVVDAQGLPTHVVLNGVETGMPLDDELFVFRNPKFDPAGRE